MKVPDITKIKGVEAMSPLDMNKVHFDKKHTVLTPEVLKANAKKCTCDASDNQNESKP